MQTHNILNVAEPSDCSCWACATTVSKLMSSHQKYWIMLQSYHMKRRWTTGYWLGGTLHVPVVTAQLMDAPSCELPSCGLVTSWTGQQLVDVVAVICFLKISKCSMTYIRVWIYILLSLSLTSTCSRRETVTGSEGMSVFKVLDALPVANQLLESTISSSCYLVWNCKCHFNDKGQSYVLCLAVTVWESDT